jgi:hypothetical protein
MSKQMSKNQIQQCTKTDEMYDPTGFVMEFQSSLIWRNLIHTMHPISWSQEKGCDCLSRCRERMGRTQITSGVRPLAVCQPWFLPCVKRHGDIRPEQGESRWGKPIWSDLYRFSIMPKLKCHFWNSEGILFAFLSSNLYQLSIILR